MLWTSPGGKTCGRTLYAAILRDMRKGKDARFKKPAPGRFTNAYRITKWYEDHGLTGTESANRPEFQALLREAERGRFEAILLHEQSRFSREDIFEIMFHWRLLREAGVNIVTCHPRR